MIAVYFLDNTIIDDFLAMNEMNFKYHNILLFWGNTSQPADSLNLDFYQSVSEW